MAAATADPRFWDRIAERYAARPIADQARYERKLALTQQYLRPDSRVLELGCGTGGTALRHAPHAGGVLATDISPGMIAIARQRLAEAGDPGNVEFRVSGVFELAEPEGGFDMVLALSLLHLVSDRAALLGRVHALLKPGGLLVSSTICLTGAWQLLRPLFTLGARAGRLPPIQLLSEARHERELREQGFTVVDRLPSPKATGGLFLVSRRD